MKRNLILCFTISVVLSSCGMHKQQTPRPELVGVYNAARSIEGALAVGVTYPEFGALIRRFSTELLLARDQAKYDPSVSQSLIPVLDQYAKILAMYKDSATVWGLELDKRTGSNLSVIAAAYGVSGAIREEPRSIGSYHYKERPRKIQSVN